MRRLATICLPVGRVRANVDVDDAAASQLRGEQLSLSDPHRPRVAATVGELMGGTPLRPGR
jgi:hypothetical protein